MKDLQRLDNFLEVIAQRRSHYALAPEWVQPEEKVMETIGQLVYNMPSAFNNQSFRVVLLKGEQHKKLWKMIEDKLISMIGQERYDSGTRDKIHNAFMSGVATFLYYDETQTTKALQEQFPTYADNFPLWYHQVQGMNQFVIWSALTEMGFGASLQHYNGLIDEEIAREFNIPESWELVAQMPFGKSEYDLPEKEHLPLEERILIRE